jgi:predicted transposase/invertase (TIGR01784 family)
MSDLIHPHDHFFRDVFSRPDAAADFLRYYLPPAVAAVLDPDSLRIVKDSFLDADLNAHYSDILYRVGLRDGGEAFVCVLFEHKSYVEPLVGLDLLRYELRVWEDVLKATPQPATLPVIIPLVVYHGRSRWTVPTRFDALLPAPTALQGYVPKFEYTLIDLSAWRDEDIRGQVILQVALRLFKYIFQPDLRQRLPGILGLLRDLVQQRTGLEYLYTVLRYLSQATDRLTPADLRQAVKQAFLPRGDDVMPTIAEQWVMEGMEKGRPQGQASLLKRQLKRRFGTLPPAVETKLDQADQAQLEVWGEQLLDAKTLEEVFSKPD